jgi:glyoxylase-like metal-dependent hydrolase (beta-lactamase superfamily II)/8-oxo-dGTP pyrophosphatase MutT (NUDIX family)
VGLIARAASILLFRGSAPPEYLVVRRAEHLRFLGGFHAFPGGKLAPEDARMPIRQAGGGHSEGGDNESIAAAARELFEETGVLLARGEDGDNPPASAKLEYLRRKVLVENLPFSEVLARLGLTIHREDFQSIGALVTPPFVPHRFDTKFFLARLPEAQVAQIWPGELVEGRWSTAAEVLSSWRAGECLVSPPTVAILEALKGVASEEILPHLERVFGLHAGQSLPPIYVAPQVRLLPLFTDTLPPTTHTNAYLVGNEHVYLFDPGTALPKEQASLLEALDTHLASRRPLTGIVLTHHHPDHIGAAALCAERYRIPVYGHAFTQKKLAGKVNFDNLLKDGDRLDLGTTPAGPTPWFLEAIVTPGHADGHLAFFDPHYRLLLAGDMVSTISSVVIAPPEGDLQVYLDSLARLRALNSKLLLPSHGGPSATPERVIDDCVAHRKQRENQLLAALDATPRTISELAQELYKGLTPKMMRFAELQLLAGLYKLRREGRAVATPENQWKMAEQPA